MDPVQEVQVGHGEVQTSVGVTPETVSDVSNPAPIAVPSETKETLTNSENSEKTLKAPESVSSDQRKGDQPVEAVASLPVEQPVTVIASETANTEYKPEDPSIPVQPPSNSEIIVVEDHQQQKNIATITLDDDVTIIPPETITIDLESLSATPCASQSDANPFTQSSSSASMEVVEIRDTERVDDQPPNPLSIAVGDTGIIVIPDEVITIDSTGDTITDPTPSQTTADTAMDIAPEESTTPSNNIEQQNPSSIAVDNATIVIPDDVLDVAQTEAVLTSSLALIAGYGMSDNDDDDDSDSSSEDESSSSSSSSSSSDEDEVQLVDTVSYRNTVNVLSSGGESGDSDVELVGTEEKKRPKKIIKAKGEMDVIDLPPIEDLNISVPAHECIELGKVMSVVDQLVLVESHPGNIALDIDTVLFLDNGNRALGRIFDVLGQVNQPIYCVRFNSAEHIQEKDILSGMKVFYNNKSEEHTSVVCLPNLLRMKGSDASWDHDIEPPQGCIEYSDDEEERTARKARKQAGQKAIPEDPTNQRMKRVRPTQSSDRGGGPPNRQARVRNPFGGPRFSHPPPQVQGNQSQQSWNNNSNNNHQMNTNHSNQWPQQTQPGYGNDYSNYSWHTYYQQQQHQQGPHAYPPPPSMPPGMPPYGGMPRGPPPGPFYANPYAQPGLGGPLPPPPVNMQHPPPQPQWGNNNGNYYQNSGGPGPSQGGGYYQPERR